MKLSLIVAVADNHAIGKDNQLIWHLPADLKHFKTLTMGKPIIMGRKTFESIGKPLPGRLSVIITRDKSYQHEGCVVVHSLEEAIQTVSQYEEAFIIGGAQIYDCAMSLVDRLYLTEVHESFDADTFFPEISKEMWIEKEREDLMPDEKNKYSYSFVTLDRR